MSASRTRLLVVLAFALPYGTVLVLSLLLRPEAGSLVAPLFGPWAGLLYGHSDCTLANATPQASTALVVFGALLLGGSIGLRRCRTVLIVLAAVWALAWEAFALLSVLNTTS